MNNYTVGWYGYFSAAPTPFTAGGDVDLGALDNVIDYLVENRAHGILVNGSTGEWFTQSKDDRRKVAEQARDLVGKDRTFLVGISSIDPKETVDLARHAVTIGADGVLLSVPPARRLSQEEVVAYYREMCRQIECPVMVYNIPPDVVTDIHPKTIGQLADIDNVVAVKDSTPSDAQFFETVKRTRKSLRVFGNVLSEPAMSMVLAGVGGHGHFGSGMPLGADLADAFEYAKDGHADKALEIAARFEELRDALVEFIEADGRWGMHAEVKAVFNLAGVDAGYPQWPQSAVQDDPGALQRLKELLREHGGTVK